MCEFELPDVSLRCFVARQLLLRIYALSSVKFQASNCGCVKKVTNMMYAEGWVRCDGKTIPKPSVWAGQRTPNLNGEKRFLRGASDSKVLTMEGDQMQDHKHGVYDPGHTHSYVDKYPNYSGNDNGRYGPKDSDKSKDRWDKTHYSTTKSEDTGITVQGVSSGSRFGSETRPKNMNVIYIMRVW